MELLAWPALTPPEETRVRAFLQSVILCELTSAIRQQAVRLRREERLKLPDAVICATALEHRVDLWTNDQRIHGILGLRCRTVAVQAPDTP